MEWIMPFLPAGLMLLGQKLQRKDKDKKGFDDAFGRALVTMGPLVTIALGDADARASLRALRAAREGLDVAIAELEAEGAE
jgi:hypothetical protein